MSETTFHRYKLKRRTTAGWASNNEVLLAGEPGIEVLADGSEKIKYGDGTKTWAQLVYAAGGGAGGAPSAHKATHATGGTDALSPGDIGAATAAQGAKADTAIQPGNAALSDAREWSAETISQSEAEAGSATTRRAFTAQRVFQAVAAWWAGSASNTKLDGIANGATANSSDAQLRDRSTHTGTQTSATISDFAASASAAAPVQSVAGRTGTVTLAKGDVGLGNVDNTSDADKPVSSATAAALAGKASTGSATTSGLTMATARLLGRTTAGAGAIEEIQVSGGTFANGTLTLSSLPSSLSNDANGNLTFTARWIQSTNGAASAPAHALTGTWFTGGTSTTTKPHFLIEPAGTTSNNWSTLGTGLGVNAPSGFTGNLLDLQVNGSSVFSVASTGRHLITGGTSGGIASASWIDFFPVGSANSFMRISNGVYRFAQAAANGIPSIELCGGWASYAGDVVIIRDAADTLAQRRTTNAQTFRLYNTFTSATNFERLNVRWTSNEAIIDTEAGSGGGTLRGLKIGSASTNPLGFYGATPIVQPAAVADATDNASAITQLNLALARLRSLGLIAT